MKLRNLHKYVSLLVSVQLLLWTISGIYFSFNKIENVRGEQYYKTEAVEETVKVVKSVALEIVKSVIATSLRTNVSRFASSM